MTLAKSLGGSFFLFTLLLIGCKPVVEIKHSPVIAKSSETVTFTAKLMDDGRGPCKVEILVNAALVKTCNNVTSGGTCTYTGGPYTAYEGTTVSYLAKATDSQGNTDTKGYYYFGITDNDYNWALSYIPARVAGSHPDKEDLIFHEASDYTSFGSFIDDVEFKMYDVYGKQELIMISKNFDTFNFYVYTKVAQAANCGTVHADANTDMPWRDDDAVLHVASLQDCTNSGLTHFSAEGSNTKAFLHESGHAVFGLADEYNSCSTGYFQPANEPNIWNSEAGCRAEQTAKSRNPDACWQFTPCQGGWWGIFQLTDGTVMQIGMVGDPWGVEAGEHMTWYFNQF